MMRIFLHIHSEALPVLMVLQFMTAAINLL
jgi:hypothetical protein